MCVCVCACACYVVLHSIKTCGLTTCYVCIVCICTHVRVHVYWLFGVHLILLEYMYLHSIFLSLKGEKPDKVFVTTLRPSIDHPWRKLADFERLLCFSAAKMTNVTYTSTSTVSYVQVHHVNPL